MLSIHSLGFIGENCSGRVSSFSSEDLDARSFLYKNIFLSSSYPAAIELSGVSDDFLSELDCSHIMNKTGNIKNVAFGIFLFISSQPAPVRAAVM